MKPTITGFFDQNGKKSFEEQIELVKKHQIDVLCLRYYNGEKLIELSESNMKKMILLLKSERIKVGIIDPLIKSYDLYDDRKHNSAVDEFKYMIRMADKLKASHLYLRLPIINDVIREYPEIEKRLETYFDFAAKNNKKIILLPELNQKANIYAYIIKKLKVNHVTVAFDPVYFMMNNESTTTVYRLLKNNIGAVRTIDADQHGSPKLIGYGKTDSISILKRLIRDRYQNFLLIDNHFHEEIFNESTKKQGFFKKLFSSEKKKKATIKQDLTRKIFPNEETKNATEDDILENQIKVLKVIFK
ncbi:MAG: hypothetical protein IH571_04465 [Acholeplasmataceae bacterium]|nr:hypothetical protein [Acholeplasmataceae bacterium]